VLRWTAVPSGATSTVLLRPLRLRLSLRWSSPFSVSEAPSAKRFRPGRVEHRRCVYRRAACGSRPASKSLATVVTPTATGWTIPRSASVSG